MNYLIEEQSQLTNLEPVIKELCEKGGIVAVDTEFFREKTYSAKLCLVQLGIGEHQYCIDVIKINDLSLLVDLFVAEKVTKLFHAARQDLEVILQTLGVLPKPIFDTQLAAAFCGADMQVGYGTLVQTVTGVNLPKSQSRTDWTRRPLSNEQIKYAGEDVAYLESLYLQGLEQLESQKKRQWYDDEIETYYDESLYLIKPEEAYKRLSGGLLKIKQQYRLKALANWREATAQSRNIPRSWVAKDDKLYELAQASVKTEQDIVAIGAFGRKSINYYVPQVLELIRTTKAGEEKIWRKTEPLSKAEKGICSSLMKDLAGLAESRNIAQALLGTRKDIEGLYRHRQSKKLLQGWRKTVVGEPILLKIQSHN